MSDKCDLGRLVYRFRHLEAESLVQSQRAGVLRGDLERGNLNARLTETTQGPDQQRRANSLAAMLGDHAQVLDRTPALEVTQALDRAAVRIAIGRSPFDQPCCLGHKIVAASDLTH